MAVPDFQTVMRPILMALADEQDHSVQEIRDQVAKQLSVTAEDRQILLPSGRQALFTNRVAWALMRLKHAKILTSEERGMYRITPRGTKVLTDYPDRVDTKVLSTFPEYVAFIQGSRAKRRMATTTSEDVEAQTPSDAMQQVIEAANETLAADLLERVCAKPPEFLERLSLDLLQSMGYGGREGLLDHTGKSGDRGLDGVVRQDALGLERIGVQAKRYAMDTSIPGKEVQAFAGALDEVAARQGVFVTTARFSKAAKEYALRATKRLVLVDGPELARLMVKYGVGLQVQESYTLQEIDDDYFAD